MVLDDLSTTGTTGEGSNVVDADSGKPSLQTPRGYATRIKEHAERPADNDIHSGVNYRALATFLNRPYAEKHKDTRIEIMDSSAPSLVCVHSVIKDDKPTTKLYRSVSEWSKFATNPPLLANNAAHLIWVSGFPPAEWINVIGAQYRVDPEFFRRYLIFLQSRENLDIAPMPSSTRRMLTIHLTTICRRPIAMSMTEIEQARSNAADSVRRHQQGLRIGDSIVRKYSVFDNMIFTIEQEMAVYVKRSKQHGGWIAMICSDLGKNLAKGPPGPWHNERPGMVSACEPVVTYVPKLALERPPRPRTVDSTHVFNASFMSQNASFLAETFELSSTTDALQSDVRDTLHDIFAFTAAAENQFLTMMQGLVDRELQLQSSGKQTEWTLSNLRYYKSTIDEHIVNVENMLVTLKRSDGPWWDPQARSSRPTSREGSPGFPQKQPILPQRESHRVLSQSRLSSLCNDYTHLLQRAEKLSNRCVENTTTLMNVAMLEESKKAIAQADGLKRLTLLAFFFLPLSLTTSFFGMNFQEFGTGKQSIWVCFVVAVPFVLFSTVLCFWESVRSRLYDNLMSVKANRGLARFR